MINLVMFHSGLLPDFIEYNFKQIRFFNPDVRVYFLTDSNLVDNDIFGRYDIIALNKDLFYSDKVKQFESCFNYSSTDFWTPYSSVGRWWQCCLSSR